MPAFEMTTELGLLKLLRDAVYRDEMTCRHDADKLLPDLILRAWRGFSTIEGTLCRRPAFRVNERQHNGNLTACRSAFSTGIVQLQPLYVQSVEFKSLFVGSSGNVPQGEGAVKQELPIRSFSMM